MKILFVHNDLATFVKADLEILRSAHEVRELHIRRDSLGHLFADALAALKGAWWADLIFAWFGGYHALLAFLPGRLLGKKCVVVASGYDVGNMPELDYGNMRPGLRQFIGRLVFRLAHKVFAVSNFTKQEAIQNAKVNPEKIEVIYHGVAMPDLAMPKPQEKRTGVITIGHVDQGRLTVKGFLNFVKVAREFPDIPFTLIGGWLDGAIHKLKEIAPPNVAFVGPLYGPALYEQIADSKVYAQLSAYESFSIAVAEAMDCGCIPVVTNRGALIEVVDNLGFVVPYNDLQATVNAIQQALAMNNEASLRCHQRIRAHFSMEMRRQRLLQSLETLSL